MLIIDGTYLVYKSYYKVDKIRKKGTILNSTHFKKIARNMFLKYIANLKNKYNPKSLFIVFDGDGDNYRHEILLHYKKNRKDKPEDLVDVKNEIYNFLELHNFAFQVADNVEGEDLIASFIAKYPKDKIKVFTGDGDLGSVIKRNVTLLLERDGKVKEITLDNCHHFFPVPPERIPDFKALQGDKSDNVKGVSGLFRSQVMHLFMQFKSLEDFFENGKNHHLYPKIIHEKDEILTNIKVTKIKKDCAITIKKEDTYINRVYIPYKIASKIGW